MHSSASCAAYISGPAKKHSLVATSGSRMRSASPTSPGSIARSIATPCRCNSIMQRPGNASASCASSRSPSVIRPSASKRAIGPRVPPVSRIVPSAWASSASSETDGAAGSDPMNPADESRRKPASPASSCASRTTGSAGRPGCAARSIETWQPMIGWTPWPTQYWLNSSAPNRLPLSAIPTAGCPSSRASAAIRSGRIAPSLNE